MIFFTLLDIALALFCHPLVLVEREEKNKEGKKKTETFLLYSVQLRGHAFNTSPSRPGS
jgi:hypothetical protein